MLKQFVLGMVFCTALIGAAHAQSKDLQFGIKGGLGFSEISGSTIDKSPRMGIQFGGVMTQKISDSLSMQYEAIYTQKGIVLKQSLPGYDYDNNTLTEYDHTTEFMFDYIEIPILAKLNISKTWAIYGGGYASIAINQKAKATMESTEYTTEAHINDSFTNPFDYGVLLGVQAQLAERWAVDARYTLGLTDVSTSGDSKNSTIAISATYLL